MANKYLSKSSKNSLSIASLSDSIPASLRRLET